MRNSARSSAKSYEVRSLGAPLLEKVLKATGSKAVPDIMRALDTTMDVGVCSEAFAAIQQLQENRVACLQLVDDGIVGSVLHALGAMNIRGFTFECICRRGAPLLSAPTASAARKRKLTLKHGEIFDAEEVEEDEEHLIFLKLVDGRGWVCARHADGTETCVSHLEWDKAHESGVAILCHLVWECPVPAVATLLHALRASLDDAVRVQGLIILRRFAQTGLNEYHVTDHAQHLRELSVIGIMQHCIEVIVHLLDVSSDRHVHKSGLIALALFLSAGGNDVRQSFFMLDAADVVLRGLRMDVTEAAKADELTVLGVLADGGYDAALRSMRSKMLEHDSCSSLVRTFLAGEDEIGSLVLIFGQFKLEELESVLPRCEEGPSPNTERRLMDPVRLFHSSQWTWISALHCYLVLVDLLCVMFNSFIFMQSPHRRWIFSVWVNIVGSALLTAWLEVQGGTMILAAINLFSCGVGGYVSRLREAHLSGVKAPVVLSYKLAFSIGSIIGLGMTVEFILDAATWPCSWPFQFWSARCRWFSMILSLMIHSWTAYELYEHHVLANADQYRHLVAGLRTVPLQICAVLFHLAGVMGHLCFFIFARTFGLRDVQKAAGAMLIMCMAMFVHAQLMVRPGPTRTIDTLLDYTISIVCSPFLMFALPFHLPVKDAGTFGASLLVNMMTGPDLGWRVFCRNVAVLRPCVWFVLSVLVAISLWGAGQEFMNHIVTPDVILVGVASQAGLFAYLPLLYVQWTQGRWRVASEIVRAEGGYRSIMVDAHETPNLQFSPRSASQRDVELSPRLQEGFVDRRFGQP